MPLARTLPALLSGAAIGLTLVAASPAQTLRTESVAASAAAAGTVIRGRIRGNGTVDYLVAAETGQRLSVDMSTTNDSLYFNILPQGSEEAIFIGSTSGSVADVPVPATGTYIVRVYLMRSAARRDEGADYVLGIGVAGGDFADGLAGGPDWWQVAGLSRGALNIRSGPDTRFPVVGQAQNGEAMQNRGCRLTRGTRWCSVRVGGSGVQGWVAGKFLVEAAAPATPQMPAGGPVGNGTPFDATGFVACAVTAGEATRTCPFGVVRDGPGNAGVWIAIGPGQERQILFEGGIPVSANADLPLSYEKTGDQFTISVGDERYAFPEALVMGG
ncbi:SH3 domain-containing protein [Cereibacter sphaeroides]|uniref:SH3 domain-containing protein n=1 Tax=Cereibacter sphaeroides TaxID=1063 RepID=UPI001F36C634|nr:SH3 domain-containing protein [Cereibacter sphaeroides]MCE6951536.1 SH3 domain-containing protein [Cereibacter sphaeroides]